jgi:hypothetical protein
MCRLETERAYKLNNNNDNDNDNDNDNNNNNWTID